MTNLVLPRNSQRFFLDGPVGRLDCLEIFPDDLNNIRGVAIVFHPDPKAGGTYTHKVVQTTAKVLTQLGYLCVCPNLRGVGESFGSHDMGIGEVEDGRAVATYLRKKYGSLPLILAGFSFGTSVASQLASSVQHSKLILIGPAVTKYQVVTPDNKKTVVIHGEDDEVIELAAVLDWARKLNQPVIWVPATGHFFHGKLQVLQNILNIVI